MLSKILKKIKVPKDPFRLDFKEEMMFMNQLKDSKGLLEKSYNQYKCQRFQKTLTENIVEWLISLFLLIPFTVLLFLKGVIVKKTYIAESKLTKAVFILSSVGSIVPDKLRQEFDVFLDEKQNAFEYLRLKDFKYILELLPFITSPYFFLKIIYKLSIYRLIMDLHKPDTIIVTSEYSFTSSFLTKYCNENNIEHVNVMHGEKALNIRDSFFQFNRAFVWDKFHIELFGQLRVSEKQFLIDLPPGHIELMNFKENLTHKYELTYYLGSEDLEVLQNLQKAFEMSNFNLSKISIRPHPRYSDIKEIQKVFDDKITIEDIYNMPLIESLKQTKRVVALSSSVLYQSHLMGKEVVIDDLTQKNKYNKLKEMKFIIFEKEHKLLSNILQVHLENFK